MTANKPFSIRQEIREEPSPKLDEAPDAICYFITKCLECQYVGYPAQAAEVLEDFLHQTGIQRRFRNPHDPSTWERMYALIRDWEWWRVYDFLEFFVARETEKNRYRGEILLKQVNEALGQQNTPYRMNYAGKIVYQGSESFASAFASTKEVLVRSGRNTAANEMHEAVHDLSRRPNPDLTGAVQHAMAALECLANDVCGENGETLGDVIKKHPDRFPEPVGTAVAKLYGFASNRGRHLSEGREPELKEVELVVGIAATVATYLSR